MSKVSMTSKTLAIIAAVMLVVTMSGCQYILPKEEKLQAPPLVEPKDVVYSTVEVKKGSIVNSVNGTGKFQSVYREDCYYTSGGRIKKIDVKIGDMVKKGDVLMELTNDQLAIDLQIAELQMQQQKNDYNASKRFMNKTQRENADIGMQISQIRLDQIKKQMEDSLLRAPIDGQVTYITTASQGSPVDAYSTMIKIEDQNTKMLTYINEGNSTFQIGDDVTVTLKDGTTAQGEVVSAPFDRDKVNKDELDKMLFIKVPDDIMAKTAVGDEARLTLILAKADDVLVLPKNVVKTYGTSRKYVNVVENNIKVEKDVEVGIQSSTEVEIVSGLTEGEKVIR